MKTNENIFLEKISESELSEISGGRSLQQQLQKSYKGSGPSSAYEAYRYSNAYKQPARSGQGTTWGRR